MAVFSRHDRQNSNSEFQILFPILILTSSKIKQFRQTGLTNNGEYSLENLAFKKLRYNGYLEKLKDLEKEIEIKSFDL